MHESLTSQRKVNYTDSVRPVFRFQILHVYYRDFLHATYVMQNWRK